MRTQRVLLDIADTDFIDPSSPAYLRPSEPVFILLIGQTKAVRWQESIFHKGWDIMGNEEYLRALVLKKSDKVEGAFERIGIIDPAPDERNNPHSNYRDILDAGKHPLTDHAALFFQGAMETVVRIV